MTRRRHARRTDALVSRPRLITRLKKLASRTAERLAEGIYQALSEQNVVVPGTEVVGLVVPRLVQQLSTLCTQREQLAREVEARVHAHPLCPVLMSLPGVGIRTAARFLTEVVCRDFHSAAHLAAYAGLSPVRRRSESSIRGEHPSRRGNKVLKRVLFLSVFATLRDPVLPRLLRAHGQPGQAPQPSPDRALARHRCDVLWATVVRDGTFYRPVTPKADRHEHRGTPNERIVTLLGRC